MRSLSTRVAEEHSALIARACAGLSRRENWATEDVTSLTATLKSLGLVGLGKLRAAWLLEDGPYSCRGNDELLADLILALALIARTAGVTIQLRSDRVVEALSPENQRSLFLVFSGKGSLRWASAEATLRYREKYLPQESTSSRPRRALVSGVVGTSPANISPPPTIVDQEDDESILADGAPFQMWSTDELRGNVAAVSMELIA